MLQRVIKIKTLNSVFKEVFFFKIKIWLTSSNAMCVGRKSLAHTSFIQLKIKFVVHILILTHITFSLKKNSQVCLFHRLLLTLEDSLWCLKLDTYLSHAAVVYYMCVCPRYSLSTSNHCWSVGLLQIRLKSRKKNAI